MAREIPRGYRRIQDELIGLGRPGAGELAVPVADQEPKPIGAVGEIDEFGPSWRGIKARLLEDLPDGRGSDLVASERASSASQFSKRASIRVGESGGHSRRSCRRSPGR